MSEDLKSAVDGPIGRITINRPQRMNSFTFEMIDEWADALEEFRRDDKVKVIVVTGAGSAFCAGADLDTLTDRLGQTPEQRKAELTERVHRIPLKLEEIKKPVIAAVNGVATGAGMDLALMCDLRFAAQSARFAETYKVLGLVPGAGGAYFLPRLVGVAKALELFMTADFVDAAEAERIGIVNRVFADDKLQDGVTEIALRMAKTPGPALSLIKQAIYRGLNSDLRTSLDMISSHYAVVTSNEEHKEAVRTFLAKRKQGNSR